MSSSGGNVFALKDKSFWSIFMENFALVCLIHFFLIVYNINENWMSNFLEPVGSKE